MKKKGSIRGFLFKNYIIIIIISICIYFLGIGIVNFVIKSIVYKSIPFNKFEPGIDYTYPYDEIDTKNIETLYGWIEILDENKRVICVKGKKLDNIYQYTEEMLYNFCSVRDLDTEEIDNPNINSPYIYSIYPIKGPHDKSYLYIIKVPYKMYSATVSLKLFKIPKNISSIHISCLLIFIGIFFMLFFIGLLLYSRFTAKHIKNPLNHLKKGIQQMESKNYKVRLNFYGEKEFSDIKNAFNDMIDRLEKSEIEREKVIQSKKRMLVDISHDLKTPITSIQGFSKLLYEEKIENKEERDTYLKYIYHKSIYVTNLIQDLFEFSKLDDENYPFNYTKQDFTEWLRILINEMYRDFEQKEIKLDIDISEIPIIYEFDKNQMGRAIRNLLENCLKYNPKGTTLNIYCYNEKNEIILKISDNGIGIREDVRGTIFEPFVRGDKSRNSKDGTGLGLAITKKVINRHRGTIKFSSEKEYVTVFTIKLPIKKEVH